MAVNLVSLIMQFLTPASGSRCVLAAQSMARRRCCLGSPALAPQSVTMEFASGPNSARRWSQPYCNGVSASRCAAAASVDVRRLTACLDLPVDANGGPLLRGCRAPHCDRGKERQHREPDHSSHAHGCSHKS